MSPRLCLLHALVGLGVTAAALAAMPAPATWTAQPSPRPAAPGSTFAIRLTAAIQPGWHLYALEEPDGGPVPTVIGLAQNDPLTLLDVTEAAPHKLTDPTTGTVAGMFTGTATFTLRMRAPRSKPPADATSHILIRYQTCNDHVCLPPHTETVALPLANLLR